MNLVGQDTHTRDSPAFCLSITRNRGFFHRRPDQVTRILNPVISAAILAQHSHNDCESRICCCYLFAAGFSHFFSANKLDNGETTCTEKLFFYEMLKSAKNEPSYGLL